MPTNTYPDGFPLTPIEAVNFSYFLSDDEKKDWREWLQTATPDQQKELVDTLHAMWEENQKDMVPAGFNSSPTNAFTNADPSISTPEVNSQLISKQPEPQIPLPSIPSSPESPIPTAESEYNSSSIDFQFDDIDGQLGNQNTKSTTAALETPDQTRQSQEDSIMSFGANKYEPNPILDDIAPVQSEFNYEANPKPQNSNQKNDRQDKSNKNSSKVQPSVGNQNSTSKPFFNVAKVREAATRTALEDVYQQYLTSREKSFSSEREYQENHGMFLDKVMQVVVNFEQVADYFESMTQKLLEMNDLLVRQAKDFQDLKNGVTSKQNDIQDQIDELRRDADRLFRETKDIRSDYRRRYDEIGEQMAAYGADAYRQDGILQRLDLLMAKVHKLEQVSKETGKVESISIADRLRGNAQQLPSSGTSQNTNRTQLNSSGPTKPGKQSIDLRNVI